MNRIILDNETRSKFDGLRDHTALYDVSGRLLGYFTSPESYAILVEALDQMQPAIRAELEAVSSEAGGRELTAILADWKEETYFAELDRRCQEEDTCTLVEIWKALGVQ